MKKIYPPFWNSWKLSSLYEKKVQLDNLQWERLIKSLLLTKRPFRTFWSKIQMWKYNCDTPSEILNIINLWYLIKFSKNVKKWWSASLRNFCKNTLPKKTKLCASCILSQPIISECQFAAKICRQYLSPRNFEFSSTAPEPWLELEVSFDLFSFIYH